MPARSPSLLDNTGVRTAAVGLALVLALLFAYVLGSGHGTVASAAPPGQSAASDVTTAGVEVLGTGKVTGTPDVLRLNLSVSITRPDATSSLDAVSTAAARVIAALKAHHAQAKDIKTSGLSVQPQEDYSKGGGVPVIRGYTASESITVVLRNLKTAGAVITAAAAAGGNATRINGVSLDLEGDSALLADARDAAFADARTKAEGYAKAAGRGLGAVTVISEQSTPASWPVPGAMDYAARASTSVPVEAGSQQVSVTVRVVWSFA